MASRRFDVGSSSITTTDARRRTVGFTNGYDFGYFSLVRADGSAITGFDKLAAGQRIGVVQGTVQEAYVVDSLHLDPVKFPDYNTVYASLKTRQIDAWVAPSQQAQGTVQPGDPAEIIENTFSLDNFVAYAVAKENKPLIDALNSGLDAVIADGTWSRLYSDWVPRELPPGLEAGVQGGAGAAAAGLRGRRRQPPGRACGFVCGTAEVDAVAAGGLVPRLGPVQAGRSRCCSRPACRTR